MATTLDKPGYRRTPERSDLLNRWLSRAYAVNWEVILYALIFLIAVLTRFSGLGDRVMSHDESLHTQFSYYLYRDGNFRHDPLMHGPILFHMTALSYFLFGDNDFVARIYPAVLGVIMVMFPLLFRRWLGRYGAILASLMILISPLLLYYHRYIREDTPSIMATMIMIYCMFMYMDGPGRLRRKGIWLYIFSGAMLWSLGSKEVAFMYLLIFFLFLVIFWVARLIQHFLHVPTRAFFTMLTLSILISGIAAMVMFAVLQIAFSSVSVPERLDYLSSQFGLLFSGQTVGQDFAAFVTWTFLLLVGFVTMMVGTMLWAYRRGGKLRFGDIAIILLLALAFSLILIVVEERSFVGPVGAEGEVATLAQPVTPIFGDGPLSGIGQFINAIIGNTPILGAWVLSLLLIGIAIYTRARGWWRTLHRFSELDLIIIIGTFVLPWATPVLLKLSGHSPIDYSSEGVVRGLAAFIPMFALSTVVGLVWNWKRWLISAAVFYTLFVFFFTTMFTNPQGLMTGMIGSLGYWLEQQGDRRGSQPQYYYSLVIMPIYEFLPYIGAFLAMLAGLVRYWVYRERWSVDAEKRKNNELPNEADGQSQVAVAPNRRADLFGKNRLRRVPVLLFISWWGIFIFIAFTLAGEKMPWLATHITVPFIFLTAWYFGRVFANIDWEVFRKRGWLLLLILPVLFAALLQVFAPFIIGQSPFDGLAQQDLARLGQWIAVLMVVGAMAYLVMRVSAFTGFMHIRRMIGVAAFAALAVITFRAAWMAAFINYDYPNEYLVYAHGAPGIKTMVAQIEEISRRTTDGMNIRFAWGGNSWPVTWYFRHLDNAIYFRENPTLQNVEDAVAIYVSADVRSRLEPLLEDRYYRFEYMRMWWPDQEYFNLSAQRVFNAFDLSPENTNAANIRHGIWDIWWSRDHTRYGQAIGKDYSFSNWPVSEQLYFYVRRDVAAQVWDLGTGEGFVANPIAQQTTASVCATNWQQLYAGAVFSDGLGLNHPLDIEVSQEGTIYVADEFNNRVAVIGANGQLINSIGGTETSFVVLNRPNGVSIAPTNDLFIADTWNYRVQSVSAQGNPLTAWGQAGQFGITAQVEPVDGFWGPRDIEIDPQGLVYVSDTGNKRIRVYTPNGQYVRDISAGGSGPGQIDEPSGLAIHPDGRLFVADTWNRRISVFNITDGSFVTSFPVLGWYEDLGNRPYLALDVARNLLYITDPDAARVLVYDTLGNCVGSFGQPGRASEGAMDASQFDTLGGIAVDAVGNVYITDSRANRVMRFAPFVEMAPMFEVTEEIAVAAPELLAAEASAEAAAQEAAAQLDAVTEEVIPEATAELTAEAGS